MTLGKFITWAPESNFPAGASLWSGNPLKLAPIGDYFTPNTGVDAEELNYLFNGSSAYIRRMAGARGAERWATPQTATAVLGGGNTFSGGAAFDGISGLWYLTGVSTGGFVSFTADGGRSWRPAGFTLTGKTPVAVAAFNYLATVAAPNGAGGLALYQFSSGGISSALSITPVATNLNTCRLVWFNAASCYVALSGLSSGNGVSLWATSDGTTDTHNLSTSIAGWGSHCGGCFTAQSPTMLLVVYSGVTAGTDAPHAATILGSSSAGLTVTDRTSTLPVIAGGFTIVGAAYNAADDLFGIVTVDSTFSVVGLWTSPDGVNWTATGNLSGRGLPSGLACSGSAWVVAFGNNAFSQTWAGAIYSTDQGATWTWCELDSGSTSPWSLYSNGRQLLALTNNGAAVAFSDPNAS